jgi:Phosphomannose isomerase
MNPYSSGILKLEPTRVWRVYKGGKLLEEWHSAQNPQDGNFPEEWVASSIKARNPNRENIPEEGLSRVSMPGGALLKELIEQDPVTFLGKMHFEKYGCNMAVLVKMIDSLSRLIIQVHPDKEFAKSVLSSDYGKTEAWYIIGGRKIDGQDPYVLIGFKPGMTKEKWKRLFEEQDIEGMLKALNKLTVKPGEVYLIEGGVPHAIGAGCFLIEIQEPTDYTMRVERKTQQGIVFPDEHCHQGSGFAKMFDCFHYDCYTEAEIIKRWRLTPKLLSRDQSAEQWALIDREATELFEMQKVIVTQAFDLTMDGRYCIAIIAEGGGSISSIGSGKDNFDVCKGDLLFIPACVNRVHFEADGNPLEAILCYPPK